MSYLIIGNGPAGVSAIERIREIDSQGKIVLVSGENNPPYSRIMIPEYMTAEVEEEKLFYRGTNFYEQHNVDIRQGCKVTKIIPPKKMVLLDNGEKINYNRLLIASGSRPVVPPWVDTGIKGIFTLWNKADSEVISGYLGEAKKAVIIGGGLVGLQSARALCTRGMEVTVIEKMARLMPLQLDTIASDILLQAAEKQGIEIYLNTEVLALENKEGKITGVSIKDKTIPADLVLITIGVKPNLEMIAETGLEWDRGLLTDECMQTNIPGIYAAGDVVQSSCRLSGKKTMRALWLSAVQQGKVAGSNMAGREECYVGSIALNSIQLFGLAIISQGQIEAINGIEEKILKYPNSGLYQKIFYEKGNLQGFIFVEDIQQAGVLYHKLGQPFSVGYWGKVQLLEEDEMLV